MFRRLLLVAVIAVTALLGATLAAGAAHAATPACTGNITIDQFSFNPASEPPGQSSTLSLVAQNCTAQTVQGNIIWSGRFTDPSGGIPPGCPVIDPISLQYTIAPNGAYSTSQMEGDNFPSCQATGLQASVSFNENGVTGPVAQATANLIIVQPTATPTPTPPPGVGCHVTYTPNNWPGGFTASLTVSNTASQAVNGWTVAFTFPGDEKITNAWNATVTQTGAAVSAASMSYDSAIPAGGSQSFGFQGTWAISDATPTSFSVNGTPCS